MMTSTRYSLSLLIAFACCALATLPGYSQPSPASKPPLQQAERHVGGASLTMPDSVSCLPVRNDQRYPVRRMDPQWPTTSGWHWLPGQHPI